MSYCELPWKTCYVEAGLAPPQGLVSGHQSRGRIRKSEAARQKILDPFPPFACEEHTAGVDRGTRDCQNAKFFHIRSRPRGSVTRTVVPSLVESISSRPPISFTRSCMLGMPTPSSNRGLCCPVCTPVESLPPRSLISSVRSELRSIRILAC